MKSGLGARIDPPSLEVEEKGMLEVKWRDVTEEEEGVEVLDLTSIICFTKVLLISTMQYNSDQ